MTAGNRLFIMLLLGAMPLSAGAQELSYAWFDIAYVAQDIGKSGLQGDAVQNVALDAEDGDGIRFRGSVGLFSNFYLFGDFTSSNIDDSAIVTNPQGSFPATDEFDVTRLRGGVGYSYPLNVTNHVVAELSYDSIDFDFGSFSGEDFDVDDKGVGARIGWRSQLAPKFEVGAHARYTSVGDVDLTSREFDSDALLGASAAWTPIRAFSIIADYEAGAIDTWAIGFRLDLAE